MSEDINTLLCADGVIEEYRNAILLEELIGSMLCGIRTVFIGISVSCLLSYAKGSLSHLC